MTRHYLPPEAPLWGAALRALPAGILLLLVARRLPSGFLVVAFLPARQPQLRRVLRARLRLRPAAADLDGGVDHGPGTDRAGGPGPAPAARALTARLLAASATGITGVVLVVGPAAAGTATWGVVSSSAALLMSSLGAVLTTRWRGDLPLVATTAWQLTSAGVALVAVAAATEGPPPRVDLTGAVAYLGIAVVATALAFLCWFAGFSRLPAGTVGLVGLLNPVTGILLGVLLGGEQLTGRQVLGIALVHGGIVIGRPRRGNDGSDPSRQLMISPRSSARSAARRSRQACSARGSAGSSRSPRRRP